MIRQFDLVAIGTGSGASAVASRCRSAGWEVAIVDRRPFGGTCALRGCDPKKVLVGAGEVVDWNYRLKGKGISADRVQIDWPELMHFKRSFVESVPKHREASFGKAGIAAFHGPARFVGPTAVQVGDEVLDAKYVAIGVGMKPAKLDIAGEEYLTTSDVFLELDKLPSRIIFIGGGYISFEFAHIAARAGVTVTMLHRGARPLVGFDPDLVDLVVKRTQELGIDVHLETKADAIEKAPNTLRVHGSTSGTRRTFEAEMVVHGAGRVPEIDDLGLEAAGVEWEPRGVKVNDYLQSVSNPAVYAAGDAAASGNPPLTPVAGYEGQIVAANLLEGNHRKHHAVGVPSVVFTVPPLASVGLQERAARDQGLRFRTNHQETSGWYASRRIGEGHAGFKVLIEDESGRILGAHLLGHHADELINLFALAIQSGIRAADLKETIFAYPTHASNIRYML